jgi:GTP cyclohydrolase I
MSRLYLLLAEFAKEQGVTIGSLNVFLREKLQSHEDISDHTCLQIEFDYLVNQPALKSEYSGWKDYPVSLKAQLNGSDVDIELSVRVPYSSTCPCSAALSRQLMQQAFLADFEGQETIDRSTVEGWLRSDRGSVATPHSQRSYANVLVKLDTSFSQLPVSHLIVVIEDALKPV